jgi:crotonobetainyl-CoA:carnitine CoA-transferase CaiB-like acyl-CoA transferase
LQANNMLVDMQHPEAGHLRLLGTPLRLHGTPPVTRTFAAELGKHTHEVLENLGYRPEEIADLERRQVVSPRSARESARPTP